MMSYIYDETTGTYIDTGDSYDDPGFVEWMNQNYPGQFNVDLGDGSDAPRGVLAYDETGNIVQTGEFDGEYLPSSWYSGIGPAIGVFGSTVGGLLQNPNVIAPVLGGIAGSIPGKQTGTQTTTAAPWEPQQPYLQSVFGEAQKLYNQPQQDNPFLSQIMDRSQSGSPLTQQAQDYTSWLAGANIKDNPLFNAQVTAQGTADSIKGLGAAQIAKNPFIGQTTTVGKNQFLGMDNPYLNSAINNASTDAWRQMNPYFTQQQRASGSFGNTGLSESQTRQAAETFGNIATDARYKDYYNQAQLSESDVTRRMQAQMGDLARNTSAQQSYDLAQAGYDDSALSRQSNALQADAQMKFLADQSNRAYQADLAKYGQNMNLEAAQMLPGLAQADYADMGVGADAWNQQQNQKWNNLKNYGSAVSGQYGSVNSSPMFSNKAASLLGGAATGASIWNAIK